MNNWFKATKYLVVNIMSHVSVAQGTPVSCKQKVCGSILRSALDLQAHTYLVYIFLFGAVTYTDGIFESHAIYSQQYYECHIGLEMLNEHISSDDWVERKPNGGRMC